MGREIVIEGDNVAYAESVGWLVRKIAYIGRRSAPDRWFFKRRSKPCPHCGSALRLKVVEYKRPGGVLSPGQARELQRLQEAGVETHVIEDIESGRDLFD